MRRLVLTHQHEWFVTVAIFEPVNRHIRDDVRAISFDADLSVLCQEVGVIVQALPRQDFPIVESLRFALQMPLTVKRRLVARFPQQLRERLLIAVEVIPVVHETVFMAVLAGENHRSTGTANRIRTETVFEQDALSGKFVDIGCRVHRLQPTVICANGMGSMIIGENEKYV